MRDEIVWEDPPMPNVGGRPSVWADRLAPLRLHPGKWSRVGECHNTTATQIKRGRMAGIQAGEFEATMRDVDKETNKGTMYVRYVGSSNGSSAPAKDAGTPSATSGGVGHD